jgi:hypothetical protein
LIGVLIVAIPCAWLGSKIESKRRERKIVEAIRALHGTVWYAYQTGQYAIDIHDRAEPSGPSLLRKLLGDDFFSEVNVVVLDRSSPAGVALLKDLTSLRAAILRNAEVTDEGLADLSGLSNLEYLDLEGTQINDAGLLHLSKLTRLKTLVLRDTHVSGDGLKTLKGLNSLQVLVLPKVPDASVNDLKIALPNCNIVTPWERPRGWDFLQKWLRP